MKRLLLSLVIFAALTAVASAQPAAHRRHNVFSYGGSGTMLLQHCEAGVRTDGAKPGSEADATFCYAYIDGVLDTLRGFDVRVEIDYCVPNDAGDERLAEAVVNFVHAHPRELNYSAERVVAEAMMDAFPCR